ncbi:MAG: amylo-alpha-1,6-glucosidase [Thermomicrobiales bacterium]
MLNNLDFVLKNNELCLFGRTEERTGTKEAGLFVRDTRCLNDFEVKLEGQPLQLLNLSVIDATTMIVESSNDALTLSDGRSLQAQSIFVRHDVHLDTAVNVKTMIQNFDGQPISLPITFAFKADFIDMFDVRNMTPGRRSVPRPPELSDGTIILGAEGSTGESMSTVIRATPYPDKVHPDPDAKSESTVTVVYQVSLDHNECLNLTFQLEPHPEGNPVSTADHHKGEFAAHFSVHSGSTELDNFVSRCDSDLAMLQTSFPDGDIPAAGIPWFIAPFGRDSLIVALQTVHAYPKRIASTLRLLAKLQGTKVDSWREEQPGKILHEMRYGDMARSGQIPQQPYYGSIDSTPLFVMAFAQHYQWHRDEALFDELIDNVRRALEWIETCGDLDGDGLLEYGGKSKDSLHISQQGWKDSWDSLHFADGRAPKGPIALVEVQGYVYAAYTWLGAAVRDRGDHEWADKLDAHAEKMRALVESSFWMEDAGFYAQALDGNKQKVDAISSNPGQLLFCRLPTQERADRVAAMLGSPELNCGWGIRTLGASMGTYNPLSYHNGSVWPHDSSLSMAGLAIYGHMDLAHDLMHGLAALSEHSADMRLHELYCGYARSEANEWPVNYPVSCSPQAWAAGTGILAMRAMLNLQPDPETQSVVVMGSPPASWNSVDLKGIAAFGKTFEITCDRKGPAVIREMPSFSEIVAE